MYITFLYLSFFILSFYDVYQELQLTIFKEIAILFFLIQLW